MKYSLLAVLLVGLVGSATAAEKTMTPQQQRMTSCNQQAATQSLKGDQRKSYMSTCLKGEQPAATGKTLTPQQQKMKDCNADAAKQSLKGDARKTFMSTCLKKK